MKIKIGEKIYSSEKDIIVLRLTEYEKELIGNMGEQEYFCIAPPNSKREGLSEAINSAKACMHITDKFDEMKEKIAAVLSFLKEIADSIGNMF
jgi:hypothetical protein